MPGFFFSHRNWDHPAPSPAGECVPPSFALGEEREKRGGGGGVGHSSDEGPYTCGTPGIYMHFGTTPSPHPQESVSPPPLGEEQERGWGVTITMRDQTLWYYRYINVLYEGSITKMTFASIFNILNNLCWLNCRANKDKKLLTCGAKWRQNGKSINNYKKIGWTVDHFLKGFAL